MNARHRLRSRGFTLVEVVVAVFVFGLLAAIAYTSLDTLTGVVDRQRERATEFARIQRAVATLDSDLRQLVSRPARGPEGRLLPALAGASDAVTGRRAGRANPAGLARSQMQQFAWRVEDGQLARLAWADVAPAPGERPVARTGFGPVEALAIRYRDPAGAWHRQWPAGGPPRQLPAAIEYEFETATFGRIRRLIVL
ncbi:MAG: type II secretion system minor pseudopilin GspJ [Wenzhouxiangellaceae bacterium]|nr:type II secretion system minor pseudopilin GspJ [Wenzhouxiangellaceae bacterium]